MHARTHTHTYRVCLLPPVLQVLHVAAEQHGVLSASPRVKACLRIRKPSLFMLAFLSQVRAGAGVGGGGGGGERTAQMGAALCLLNPPQSPAQP